MSVPRLRPSGPDQYAFYLQTRWKAGCHNANQLWREITEKQNRALAIVVGALSIGICMIISAAIHG